MWLLSLIHVWGLCFFILFHSCQEHLEQWNNFFQKSSPLLCASIFYICTLVFSYICLLISCTSITFLYSTRLLLTSGYFQKYYNHLYSGYIPSEFPFLSQTSLLWSSSNISTFFELFLCLLLNTSLNLMLWNWPHYITV